MMHLAHQADPLADQVVQVLKDASPEVKSLLQQGMKHGVATIPQAPSSFRALLTDAEQAVKEVSTQTLEIAREPYLMMGPLWMSVSLGPGALVHTYADPGVAAVLMRTGNLTQQTAARRLLETQIWNISVLRDGGLSVGGVGYSQTLQVRLLHARVRSNLLSQGWSHRQGSLPMDQRQMVRTWLDFTFVSWQALMKMGVELQDTQLRPIYSMWRLIGRLLGISPEMLSGIQDHKDAQMLLDQVDADSGPPSDDSRTLTRAMLDALGMRLAPVWGMPTEVSVLLVESMCRLFHGDAYADLMGLKPNWTASLLPIYADANRYRLFRAVHDQDFKLMLFSQSQKAFEMISASLEGEAAFEKETC